MKSHLSIFARGGGGGCTVLGPSEVRREGFYYLQFYLADIESENNATKLLEFLGNLPP